MHPTILTALILPFLIGIIAALWLTWRDRNQIIY